MKHKEGICDKCLEKKAIWKLPYLYCDMNDTNHKDEGRGYRQYELCNNCQKVEFKILKQLHPEWNKQWQKLN